MNNTPKHWTEYRPPSADWLKKTGMSPKRLYKCLWAYARMVGYLEGWKTSISKALTIADDELGQGQMLDNKRLGKCLHLRRFLLECYGDDYEAVRLIRRWDRRMIDAMRK